MMEPLTRDTVELIRLSFIDDGLSYEQRQALQRMVGSDAALRARLTEMTEERDAVLHGGVTEEMLRRQDGTIRLAKGCCIVIESEWDETLRQLTEAQQETARLHAAVAHWQASGIAQQQEIARLKSLITDMDTHSVYYDVIDQRGYTTKEGA